MAENPFYAFVNLVELDQSIDQRIIKREKLQIVIDQVKQRSRTQQETVAAAGQKLHDLRKQFHQTELEHTALQQQEKNKRTKLDAVNTAKEYAALEHELQLVLQQEQTKEEEVFALWARIEQQEAQVKKDEHELAQLQKKDQEEMNNIEHERSKLAQEIDELKTRRPSHEQAAPEEFVAKYATMRSSLKNPVVAVHENNCSACGTQVRQADLLQLRRHVIVPCTTCYRLLYMK